MGARPGRARPPLRRRAVGGPAPRPPRHGRRPRRASRGRRRHLARAVPHLGPHRPGARRRAHLALPAGARGSPAGAGAGPDRRPRHRPATGDPGRLPRPRALRRPRRPAAAQRQRRPRRLPALLARLGGLRRADDDARPDGRLPRAPGRRPAAHRCPRRPLHLPRRGAGDRRRGDGRRRPRRPRGRRTHPRRAVVRHPRRARRRVGHPPLRPAGRRGAPARATSCAACATSSSTPAP